MIRSFSLRGIPLGLVLGGVFLAAGCDDSRRKTGTLVEKNPILEAGEKASMDGMKAAMKAQGKK